MVLSYVPVRPMSSRFSFQWTTSVVVSLVSFHSVAEYAKPVKSADGETGWINIKGKKTALLGPDSMWLKTTALQKAGVTEKIFFQKKMMWLYWEKFPADACYNNHSDIILLLKFLLMMFLSDALMVSNGVRFCITEKPDSAVSGWSCSSAASQCIHPHCTTDSLWSGQHLLSVLSELTFFKFINQLKTFSSKSNQVFML